ncbi:DNA polymerase delta subunit 3-like isoform X2 [Dysidea avara]|uniref:DNA polymerase delta subunit 3-like isoform X2 n=1 Tax=Dysidea avara TaxID=196820 RepID=UPI0033253BCB
MTASDHLEDNLYLENIDEYVYDMDKIVTYKWLAMTLSVPFSEAARMLDTFVQQHSAPPPGKEPVAVTYLVTGVSHDPERDDDKVIVSLADEDDVEEVKAGLTDVHSVIIYSVQKGVLKDRSALFTAEYEILKDNLHKYAEMGAVKCCPSSVQHSKPVTPNEEHPVPLPSLSHMKEDKLNHQGKKRDHQDQKLGQGQKQDHHSQKQDHKLSHQEKSNQHHKSHQTLVSSNKGGGLVAMFAKQNAQKSTKAAAKNSNKQKKDTKPVVKQETQKSLNIVKSEPQSEVTKQDEQVSKPGGQVSIEDTKQDESPTRAEQDEPSSPEKKTGRVVFDKEVFTSSEDEGSPEANKKISPETKPQKVMRTTTDNKAPPKRRRVCQEFSSGESDVENNVKVNEGSHGKKRRKVVKKLVNKMYIDEDGAMVTEKEWQDISTDDDEPTPAVAATNKTTSTKTKSKQATLGAFFHKK